MSVRILLARSLPENIPDVFDAHIEDFKDFEDFAMNAPINWGDNTKVWADEHYLPSAQAFIEACEKVHGDGIICYGVAPLKDFMVQS